jgi:hypothetical protein
MISNMLAGRREFSLTGSYIDVNELSRRVFQRCPKLAIIFKDMTLKYDQQKAVFGLVTIESNYKAEVIYQEPYKDFDINSVIEDNGQFNIVSYIKKYKYDKRGYPVHLPITSTDTNGLWKSVGANNKLVYSELPGLEGLSCEYSENKYIIIHFNYKYDPSQIYNMENSANNEAEKLVRILFGNGQIPPFLKVFLTFSYIQQTCKTDTMYIESLKRGMKGVDIAPELAFSVLGSTRHNAVSKGIASAMTLILTKSGIECITVEGKLLVENSEDEYYWNMVKLGGVWYHLDASWFLDTNGINVSRFMCNHNKFMSEHRWYEGTPIAKGCTFDYDYIEDYINENCDKLIASGISQKYLQPEEVYE